MKAVGIQADMPDFVGFENDCVKYAEAMMLGYVVLRVTPRQITQGKALQWITTIVEKLKGHTP